MVSRLTGCRLHDHNCGFKLYRREVLREVGIYGELHRFIPVLAHARGFRVGEVEVRHRRRRHGASKYGVSRFIKGFLDLLTVRFLTRFRERPLHMLGGIGLALFGLGGIGMLSLAVMWLDPANRPIGTSPFAILFDCTLARRSPARDPGHPGRAGHLLQHSHRGCLQHRRADSSPATADVLPGATLARTPGRRLDIGFFSIRPSRLFAENPARARFAGTTEIDRWTISKRLRRGPSHDGLMAQLVIIAATSLALGHCLRQPTQMGANDISRWCTVWSLLERGTYVIDDCPWQIETQDKVLREPKGASGPSPGKHFYSSKPALLPTLIAGILYPARMATGVPLDRVVLQERQERWTQKPDPTLPTRSRACSRRPRIPPNGRLTFFTSSRSSCS